MKAISATTFFGCSCGEAGEADYEAAKQTAAVVAQMGCRVVNGGGPGIMHAATEGAKSAGGNTTVVYYTPQHATSFEGKTAVNLADETFEEANYVMRTKKLLELGDVYIIFNGGTGTVSEFGMAWGLARLYFGHHKPLILYGDFWSPIIDAFSQHTKVRPDSLQVFSIVNSPAQVQSAITKYDEILHKNRHEHADCAGPECFLML